jgi:hypothetical protein
VLGALLVVIGLTLAVAMIGSGQSVLAGSGMCCCALAFAPFGIFPAWLGRRRDPRLTPGQAFSLAFITVGLGSVLWAAPNILQGRTPDRTAVRRHLVDLQQDVPEESRRSSEDLDAAADFIVAWMPYLPAIHAAITTLLAGFAGMLTVARMAAAGQRREPSPGEPGT